MFTDIFVSVLLLATFSLAARWLITPSPFAVQSTTLSGHGRTVTVISRDKYYVGWICALPVELAAAQGMLDKTHECIYQPDSDTNIYTLGIIAGHNVVIAGLPSYGTSNAAIVATNMRRTFPSIRVWLMVGIGGGVPGHVDIRLGDVVGTKVLQIDLGKIVREGRLHRTKFTRTPTSD